MSFRWGIFYKAGYAQDFWRVELSTKSADPYPSRIVTFIDILGFKRDIEKLDTNPALYLSIEGVLQPIATCKRNMDAARNAGRAQFDQRMTHFSDCVVMSYANVPGASLRALADAAFVGQALLRRGYLPRGAIVLGNFVHSDDVVFGSALVAAYELEQHFVKTPRVFIADKVMPLVERDLRERHPKDTVGMYVKIQSNNQPFVHLLGKDWPFLAEMRGQVQAGVYASDGIDDMYRELQAMLPIRYGDAPDDSVRAKNAWMRDYVNATITEQGLDPILKVTFPSRPSPSRSRWQRLRDMLVR